MPSIHATPMHSCNATATSSKPRQHRPYPTPSTIGSVDEGFSRWTTPDASYPSFRERARDSSGPAGIIWSGGRVLGYGPSPGVAGWREGSRERRRSVEDGSHANPCTASSSKTIVLSACVAPVSSSNSTTLSRPYLAPSLSLDPSPPLNRAPSDLPCQSTRRPSVPSLDHPLHPHRERRSPSSASRPSSTSPVQVIVVDAKHKPPLTVLLSHQRAPSFHHRYQQQQQQQQHPHRHATPRHSSPLKQTTTDTSPSRSSQSILDRTPPTSRRQSGTRPYPPFVLASSSSSAVAQYHHSPTASAPASHPTLPPSSGGPYALSCPFHSYSSSPKDPPPLTHQPSAPAHVSGRGRRAKTLSVSSELFKAPTFPSTSRHFAPPPTLGSPRKGRSLLLLDDDQDVSPPPPIPFSSHRPLQRRSLSSASSSSSSPDTILDDDDDDVRPSKRPRMQEGPPPLSMPISVKKKKDRLLGSGEVAKLFQFRLPSLGRSLEEMGERGDAWL